MDFRKIICLGIYAIAHLYIYKRKKIPSSKTTMGVKLPCLGYKREKKENRVVRTATSQLCSCHSGKIDRTQCHVSNITEENNHKGLSYLVLQRKGVKGPIF